MKNNILLYQMTTAMKRFTKFCSRLILEDYGKSYILLIPAGSEPGDQVDVLAYSFDSEAEGEDVDLNEIESDEEWDMVEGVLDTFLNDENMQ